jgi:hypothetical protein
MTDARASPPRFLIVLALAGMAMPSPVSAQDARYEIFPEQSVRRGANHWVSSAYVLDKRGNRLWICTARYNFDAHEANNGDCASLPSATGRPSLTERYKIEAVLGASTLQGPYYPLFWFIEPSNGDVQFCAPRHPGVCLRIALP